MNVLGNGGLERVQHERQQLQRALHRAELELLQTLVCFAVLCIPHPGELDRALVNVVPDCLPILVSKTGSPHICLGEHRETAGTVLPVSILLALGAHTFVFAGCSSNRLLRMHLLALAWGELRANASLRRSPHRP